MRVKDSKTYSPKEERVYIQLFVFFHQCRVVFVQAEMTIRDRITILNGKKELV